MSRREDSPKFKPGDSVWLGDMKAIVRYVCGKRGYDWCYLLDSVDHAQFNLCEAYNENRLRKRGPDVDLSTLVARIEALEAQVLELRYAPGMPGAVEAEASFNNQIEE